jgi:hypothetical protein
MSCKHLVPEIKEVFWVLIVLKKKEEEEVGVCHKIIGANNLNKKVSKSSIGL